MLLNRRVCENPVAHLKPLNARTDRRRERRALEVDEVRRLLSSTRASDERYGMSGPERAWLYRIAVETGLRVNELRSLTVASFDLDASVVTVEAGYSKRRREDTLPLRPDTAAELKSFFSGKLPGVKAFGGRYKKLTDKTAKMIEADLTEAGICYQDDAGRYADFHSLRHTAGTWLAASGVHPKVAQSIMRHSDINLTMSTYSHTLRGQEAEAVAKLPDLAVAEQQAQRATGTDQGDVTVSGVLASDLALRGAQQCTSMHTSAQTTLADGGKNAVLNTPGRTRTSDLRIRNPLLYPTELRALMT